MSRTLKRVPMNFSWPTGQLWGGYVNPYYKLAGVCPDCEHGFDRAGGRRDANAALFHDQWYGNALFNAAAYGAVPISPNEPAIWDLASSNVDRAPDFYMSQSEAYARAEFRRAAMDGFPGDDRPLIPFPTFHKGVAIAKEAKRLYDQCFRGCWSHQLIQADVDALIAHDRLWDFTRVPRNAAQAFIVAVRMAFHDTNSWLPESNGHHPTAAEVNAWSLRGFGHDASNAAICIEARCDREGVPYMCTRCTGSGEIWPTPEIKEQYETWTPTDPPTGEGYQLWETTSEGSPVSPVFSSLEELCAWSADHATTFASCKASAQEWRQMLEDDFVHATDGNGNFFR